MMIHTSTCYIKTKLVESKLGNTISEYRKISDTTIIMVHPVDAALCVIGLRDVFTEEDLQNIKAIIHAMQGKKQDTNSISLLKDLEMKVNETFDKHSQKGRTSKLWVEYHYMVNRIKNFIRAERTHDWELHIQCVGDMLDTFAAAGHGKLPKEAGYISRSC